MTPGIILLEGADASGKTTLARHLVDRHGARYLHSTVRRDCWRWHLGALRLAERLLKTANLIVLDRHWISEQVYGATYRGGPQYDLGARCLDRVLQSLNALTVLCVPADQEGQVKRHAELKTYRREHFDQIGEVVARYADLYHGNLARPGDSYVDQLTRYGDYHLRADVMRYDLDAVIRGAVSLPQFVNLRLLPHLRLLVNNQPVVPAGVIGNLTGARYLFVGERVSPQLTPPWPFFWNDSLSAASYLNGALHRLAFDETHGLWANAEPDAGQLGAVHALRPDLRVIALGRVAQVAARKYWANVRAVPHPQYWRRFHAKDPEGYVSLLREALRG